MAAVHLRLPQELVDFIIGLVVTAMEDGPEAYMQDLEKETFELSRVCKSFRHALVNHVCTARTARLVLSPRLHRAKIDDPLFVKIIRLTVVNHRFFRDTGTSLEILVQPTGPAHASKMVEFVGKLVRKCQSVRRVRFAIRHPKKPDLNGDAQEYMVKVAGVHTLKLDGPKMLQWFAERMGREIEVEVTKSDVEL